MLTVTIEEILDDGCGAIRRRSVAIVRIAPRPGPDGAGGHAVSAMQAADAAAGLGPGIAECAIAEPAGCRRVWALVGRACEQLMEADWVEF